MRQKLKKLFRAIAFLMILPILALYQLLKLFFNRNLIFPAFSQLLAQIPGHTGIYLRREFYRRTLSHCTKDCVIGFGSVFAVPEVSLGSKVSIGRYCCFGATKIEEGTQIASRVSFISGLQQHYRDASGKLIDGKFEQVVIGKHVWIGEGAIIACDVGDFCNIAAGAVVLKPIPNQSTAIGNPAKIIANVTS